ncbi:hypothetical protein C0992_007125, partial [Termitomyces sp. T32_za158]
MSNIHGPAQSFGLAGSAPRQRVQFEPEQSNEQQLSDEPSTSSSQQLHERTPSPILQPSEQERGITRRLESIVDGFRTGHASKCDAITGIINCISKAELDGRFKQESITSYIILLEDIETKERDWERRATHREEAERQRDLPVPDLEQTQPIESIRNTEQSTVGPSHREATSSRTDRERTVRTSTRESQGGRGYDSDTTEGSEYHSDKPETKKRRVKKEELPWFTEEKLARENEDSRCKENRRLLKLYLKDPAGIK